MTLAHEQIRTYLDKAWQIGSLGYVGASYDDGTPPPRWTFASKSASRMLVLVAIADLGDRGQEQLANVAHLAELTGLSQSTVRKKVKEMTDMDAVTARRTPAASRTYFIVNLDF